jgi:DNA-binding response OmpR family regulator
MHVALITKDQNLSASIRSSLHECGFGTTIFADSSAIESLASGLDLLICDLGASAADADAAALALRKSAPSLPLIAVTAGDSPNDRLRAFRAGFDDAVARSVPAEEIALRAQSLIRRSSATDHAVLKFADVVLDRVARTVTRSGKPIRLTEREYRTMEYLMRNPKRVIKPEELCEQVWKFRYNPSSNVVQVFIMRLRKKIDESFPATTCSSRSPTCSRKTRRTNAHRKKPRRKIFSAAPSFGWRIYPPTGTTPCVCESS